MLLASNRSMSYLKPKTWFMRMLNIFKRRQCIDIRTQYEQYGVRCFDIRLYPTKRGIMQFTNGSIEYITFSVYSILNYLNTKGDCYVMLTLDDTDGDVNNTRAENRFREYCDIIEQIYPFINFFDGRNRKNGSKLYTFNYERINGTPTLIDYLNVTPSWSSEDCKLIKFVHRVCPYLYARWFNVVNFVKTIGHGDHVIFFADYVNFGMSKGCIK